MYGYLSMYSENFCKDTFNVTILKSNNETIDKLEKINSHIYNTQTDGEITLNLDNQLISSFNRS